MVDPASGGRAREAVVRGARVSGRGQWLERIAVSGHPERGEGPVINSAIEISRDDRIIAEP